MRIVFITLLLLISCPLAGASFADDKSDCLNICANEKRANDMYCPPAGGFTDEDSKQCMAKNSADFISCKNICSPPVTPPADQQTAPAQLPAIPHEEPVSTDKQY
jgi:hypothetical protein